jgi:hypothetical protein
MGRKRNRDARLPPGQYDTGKSWPVLTAEATPKLDLATWTFTVDGLADTLVQVVNRPAERAARAANARAHARAVLSWDGLVPRFVAVYALATEAARRRVAARGGA